MISVYNSPGQVVEVGASILRFVTILDPHFSPVTPASRKDDFLASTEDAFRQAIKFGVKVNASALIIAGDLFHLKSAGRNPSWFMTRMILLFKEAKSAGLDVLAIAGNHDLTFGSLASLSTQPIGLLAAADSIHLLDEKSVVYKGEGFSLRIAGCSFHHSEAAPVRDLQKEGPEDYLVGVGHFWFGKATGEFYGEPVYGPDFFANSKADAFVIGHHHADQGIQVVDGRTYFAHGSMNRIGAHAGDLERRPAVGLLEVTSKGITGAVARLKVPPADEVFDLEKQKEVSEERKELDKFMQAISNEISQGDDVGTILGGMVLAPEVRARVDSYLEKAEEKRD